jgi:hypothetical protein
MKRFTIFVSCCFTFYILVILEGCSDEKESSDGESVLDEASDGRTHRRTCWYRGSVGYFEQIRLHIVIGGIKNQLQIGLARHLGHIVMTIHYLGNVHDLKKIQKR